MSVAICPACGSVAVDPTGLDGARRCRRCGERGPKARFFDHVHRPQASADWDGRAHVDGRVLAPGITDGGPTSENARGGMPGEGET